MNSVFTIIKLSLLVVGQSFDLSIGVNGILELFD